MYVIDILTWINAERLTAAVEEAAEGWITAVGKTDFSDNVTAALLITVCCRESLDLSQAKGLGTGLAILSTVCVKAELGLTDLAAVPEGRYIESVDSSELAVAGGGGEGWELVVAAAVSAGLDIVLENWAIYRNAFCYKID